jgi:hypothetical protein
LIGPSFRMKNERCQDLLLPALIASAATISARLGHQDFRSQTLPREKLSNA